MASTEVFEPPREAAFLTFSEARESQILLAGPALHRRRGKTVKNDEERRRRGGRQEG